MSNLIEKEKILDMLQYANLAKFDQKNKLILIWNGGHGVNIFNFDCELRYFFNFISQEDEATEKEVIAAMNRRIEQNDYQDFRI